MSIGLTDNLLRSLGPNDLSLVASFLASNLVPVFFTGSTVRGRGKEDDDEAGKRH